MTHPRIGFPGLAALVLALALAGCGDAGDSSTTDRPAPAAQPVATGPGQEEATSAAGGRLDPCALLDAEQVSSVLPGHDGGSVTHDGGSLMEGIDAFQCSWMVISGTDVRMLTLILNVASTDALFEEIKPTGFAREDDAPLALADGGWSGGEADRWKVTIMKGRTLIDLELSAPGADQHSARLVEFAGSIAGRL